MKKVEGLNVKIFADGADKAGMLEMYAKPFIKGLTTNPTLMRKVGITDYKAFSLDILKAIPDRPISLEVFSDEFADMERQAMEIAGWGQNVYVKIPVMNTKRQTSYKLIEKLAARKVKLNITALMTLAQVRDVVAALDPNVPSYVSVFAGRVADTGRDPLAMMGGVRPLLQQGEHGALPFTEERLQLAAVLEPLAPEDAAPVVPPGRGFYREEIITQHIAGE